MDRFKMSAIGNFRYFWTMTISKSRRA